MNPSEDPSAPKASPKVRGLETDGKTSSGGKPGCHQKAIPPAHLTFIIDCARGRQISLTAPPVLPRAPSSNPGTVTPPMKTYILFCGENRPYPTQKAPLGRLTRRARPWGCWHTRLESSGTAIPRTQRTPLPSQAEVSCA
ncbi:steroid receptor-associated and regulated protein isoform X2 [Crocuta crocuta]